MNETQLRMWSQIREKGKWRYVLRKGVFGWGVITGGLFALLMGSMKGWDQFPVWLVISLVVFSIIGIAFGMLLWKTNETNFSNVMKDEEADAG